MQSTGIFLKQARQQAALTQAEVAEYLKCPFQVISAFEIDARVPSVEKLKLLCEKYRVSFDEAFEVLKKYEVYKLELKLKKDYEVK